jgi:hypothetical protein
MEMIKRADFIFRLIGLPDDIARIVSWLIIGGSLMAAVVTWTIDFVRSLPLPALGLFTLGAFIVSIAILFAIVRIGRNVYKRIFQRADAHQADATVVSPETNSASMLVTPQIGETEVERLAREYKTLLHNDRKGNRKCWLIRQDKIDWGHANPARGAAWLDFYFEIRAIGVYNLVFTEGNAKGQIQYTIADEHDQGIISDPPKIHVAGTLYVPRTQKRTLVLRQNFHQEIHSDFNAALGDRIQFDFSEVRVPVQFVRTDSTNDGTREMSFPSCWKDTITLFIG